MISIFSEHNHPRIQYVFKHIFKIVLAVDFEIVTNKDEFQKKSNPKISYTEFPLQDEIHIKKNGTISKIENIENWEMYDGVIQCFLLLSRYEEYLPFVADKHQRFPFSQSKQFKYIDVEKPFVDDFAYELKTQILKKFPQYVFPEKKPKIVMTVDVDRVYKVLSISKKEAILYLLKRMLKFDWNGFFHYFKVNYYYGIEDLQPKIRDEYDTYNYILKHFPHTIFFVQVGKKGKFDNNYNPENESFKRKIETLSWKQTIGLHPSYQSNEKTEILHQEKQILEKMIGKNIENSRQHYLKLKFPETYRNLLQCGITKDYTLGFADQIGFRAGTSHPFFWYDLDNETETNLELIPFQIMDVTLKNYLQFSPKKSIEKVQEIYHQTKKVNGTFVCIFHNQNLTNKGEWKNWNQVFESLATL